MMEGRSVLIAKLPIDNENQQNASILISPSLKHLIFWIHHKKVILHSLSKQHDYEHRGAQVIWFEHFLDVESVLFSHDGKQFAVFLRSQPSKVIVYNLAEQTVTKASETVLGDFGQLTNSPSRSNKDICDSVPVAKERETLVYLHKNNVVLYGDGTLYSIHLTPSQECVQNYVINFESEVLSFHFNTNCFYYLDDTGSICIHKLEDGGLTGVFDIYKILPKNLQLSQIYVNSLGNQVALLGEKNEIFILAISTAKVPSTFTSRQPSSARGSSSSVSSFKTSVSKISSYSRVDSLKREVTTRKIASIANATSATSNWLSYLEKLAVRRQYRDGLEEDSGSFVCIHDVPPNYIIRSLHFCQDNLGVWAKHTDDASDGIYRVYDALSGQLEIADMLAPDTQIVHLDSSSVSIDLLLQGSNLCLPLGIISRDMLVQKMVGGENENLVDEMIGQAVLPLPLLQEGLSRQQLDMVRLALNLHTQGFKSKLREDRGVEELVNSTKQLFETIGSVEGKSQWRQQVCRLALTHANTLLSLLVSPTAQDPLLIEILQYVALLRRTDLVTSVDLPIVYQWIPWIPLSDEEVILRGAAVSLPLVQCFLALHRGWSEDDLRAHRFHCVVQQVVTKLLKEKELSQAKHLLTKVNFDPDKEFEVLCLESRDPLLRDYLMDNLSSKMKAENIDAWQFLSLVESVLVNHGNIFPKLVESPLRICDVLLLTKTERAQIVADLYFSTGDPKLEAVLDKNTSWEYLLEHNCTEGILAWLSSDTADSMFEWPLQLFSDWKVDQIMVDKVVSSDCTDLTKHIVLNKLATFGIFPSLVVKNPKMLLMRMANSQLFPDVERVLAQETASISDHHYSQLMLHHAIKNNLVEVVVKFDLDGVTCDHHCPDWLKLLTIHRKAGKTWDSQDTLQAIEECTKYLARADLLDKSVYLKQHPLVAVVTDVFKNQDICQLHSHVSPLLAAAVPIDPPPQDITLYSVLAHTVPFHTDNIFQHQLSAKRNVPMPDFTSENLSLRYGINYSLGFKEFLKQGRPGSAISYIMQKGRTSIRKKAAVGYAHGLALCNAHDVAVTSACTAFVELLGQDSTLLRTHVAVARTLIGSLNGNTLRDHLFNLVQGREGTAAALLSELETHLWIQWMTTPGRPNNITCLQQLHLAVHFSVCHNLPPPLVLLKYCLETNNWLLFILTAQIFQYPMSSVQEVCTANSKHEISEHLYHALHSSARNHGEEKVTKTFESERNLLACLAQSGNDAEELFNLSRQLNIPALALLASSLQPLPIETGLSWWLVASLPPEASTQSPLSPWNPDRVTHLLELVVKLGYFYTLAHGFSIFHPVSPFCALANFFVDSVVEHKFKESVVNLKLFMAAFANLSSESSQESSFLLRRNWVAKTAYRLVYTALAHCFPSAYHRHCFLKTLCEARFSETLQEDQSLPLYLRMSECLMSTSLQLDWRRLCLEEDLSQLSAMLHSLTEQHMFDTAFKFALIAGLPCDNILITQWSVLASATEVKEKDFWNRCEAAFQQANIDPEVAVNFYENQASSSDDLQERYLLLKFALGWMCKTPAEPETIVQLQTELYVTCLDEKFKTEVLTEGMSPSSLRCLSDELVTATVRSPPRLHSSQYHRLDSMIHQLLVVGDIRTAFVLQSVFHHANQDCELLLACMWLAERVKSVSELPPRIQEYLTDEAVRRPRMTFASPLPKMRSKNNLLESDSQTILDALYALQAHQTCATSLFGNIISAFKISLALNCQYKDIILEPEPLNRLHVGLDFEVATGLVSLASLTRFECTQYVCSQIVSVLSTEPEDGRYMLWSCDLDSEFTCILELSGSALLLGNLLLASDPLACSHPSTYRQGVELLVLAHNCFTKVCHMEGIASVLNLARSLVSRLLNCGQWPLMVRLLTGIGRYTEMGYIFQILKDNDQFEFLLGKGLDKQPQLMAATLEFVRHDKELFSLVAHHFSMYSELAALYEEEAKAELSKIEVGEAGIAVTAYNKASLQTVMSKYTDATEHYMQAKKMKCGVSSIQQAELIAVQLSLLANTTEAYVPCLVNLTTDQAVNLVNTVLSCEQAHIVASAYNIPVDWSAALYHNCVVRGDAGYLTTWTRHHQLTKSLVLDVVRRFESEGRGSGLLEGNMKWFVSSVSLLDVKYRVASQLGFKDILQSLLTSPDMAYLKDTVWQSGFKNQIV